MSQKKTLEVTRLKAQSSTIDQWQKTILCLRSYKITCVVLSALIGILCISILLMSMRGPVVVLTDGNSSVYLKGDFRNLKVDKVAVTEFIKDFLKARYEWLELDEKLIYRQISPLTTTAFSDKVIQEVSNLRNSDFKDKVVSQSITNVSVAVDEKKIFAKFDRLIKVQGIALPIATQAIFQVNSGPRTKWNPVGLYVNGIIEHEGK